MNTIETLRLGILTDLRGSQNVVTVLAEELGKMKPLMEFDFTETRGRGFIGKNNNNTINLLYNFAEAYII